jgi:hypothetical protein
MEKNNSNILDLTDLKPVDSRSVDEIAEEIRRKYVDYIVEIGRKNEKNIDWWMLNFVSRNTFISNLFRNFCFLVLLDRKLRSGCVFNEVVVDSLALKKVIEKYKSDHHFKVTYKGKSTTYISLKRIYSYLKIASHFFIMWMSKQSPGTYQKNIPLDNKIILIDTFVLTKSFDDGSYRDHYYPTLFKYINSSDKDYIYFVPSYYGTKNYKRLLKKIRKSDQKFLLKEDYLRITDYIFALLYFLRIRRMKILNKEFMGFNVSPLIKEEILDDSVSKSALQGLVNYRFSRRLKEREIKIKLVINWFENQTIDHGFNFGFRKNYPSAHLIGYQGFQLINNYLSLYPTEQERRCRVIPQVVCVIGKGYIKLARQFCPDLKIKVVPSFRHDWVWSKREFYPNRRKFTILITLSMLIKESEELMRIVLEAFRSLSHSHYSVQIKLHPTYDKESFKNKWGKLLPEGFEFIEEDFYLCLERSNLLISCTSCTCFEALARGIPVIVIANNFGLTQLYIPSDVKQDIWRLCYDSKEVTEAIKFYNNISDIKLSEYKKIGYNIREKYFKLITRKGAQKIFNL